MKLQPGRNQKIATINIRGVKKPGVREEIERWMLKHNVPILGLQETRNAQNSCETRKQHTWFFSGEGGRKEYTAGVGLATANKYSQYRDIEPVTDRLMYLTLGGVVETTLVITYMPPADRPEEEKTEAYEDLQKLIDKRRNRGPTYILGDWNARLICPASPEEEEEVMGETRATREPRRTRQIHRRDARKQ